MVFLQRNIIAFTLCGKKYCGKIDIPRESMRTTDLFNSNALYWRDQNEKCHDHNILFYDTKLILEGDIIYKKFNNLQVNLSDIVFFYDDLITIGDEQEKTRAGKIREKTNESKQSLTIITPRLADSFYDIQGSFYGLFKKKSQDSFIPLFEVTVKKIEKINNKWAQKKINLPHNFVGVNTQYIESLAFGS